MNHCQETWSRTLVWNLCYEALSGTMVQNVGLEPLLWTTVRNHGQEPLSGTSIKNRCYEPLSGTMSGPSVMIHGQEPRSGTSVMNHCQEPQSRTTLVDLCQEQCQECLQCLHPESQGRFVRFPHVISEDCICKQYILFRSKHRSAEVLWNQWHFLLDQHTWELWQHDEAHRHCLCLQTELMHHLKGF